MSFIANEEFDLDYNNINNHNSIEDNIFYSQRNKNNDIDNIFSIDNDNINPYNNFGNSNNFSNFNDNFSSVFNINNNKFENSENCKSNNLENQSNLSNSGITYPTSHLSASIKDKVLPQQTQQIFTSKLDKKSKKAKMIEDSLRKEEEYQKKVLANLENHPFFNNEIVTNKSNLQVSTKTNKDGVIPGFLPVPFSSSIYKSNLKTTERMKEKRMRAKKMLKQIIKRKEYDNTIDTNNTNNLVSDNTNIYSNEIDDSVTVSQKEKCLSKKLKEIKEDYKDYKLFNEIKVLRNRIAAQKSRDKKLVENNNIKSMYQKVVDENTIIKKLTESQAEELNLLKSQLELLCQDCTSNLESRLFASKFKLVTTATATTTINKKLSKGTYVNTELSPKSSKKSKTDTTMFIDSENESTTNQYVSHVTEVNSFFSNESNRNSPITKFGVFGSLLAVVCIIGAFFLLGTDNTTNILISSAGPSISTGSLSSIEMSNSISNSNTIGSSVSTGIYDSESPLSYYSTSQISKRMLFAKEINSNDNIKIGYSTFNYSSYINKTELKILEEDKEEEKEENPNVLKEEHKDNLPQIYKNFNFNTEEYWVKFLKYL